MSMNSCKFLAPAFWGLFLLFPIGFNGATPRRAQLKPALRFEQNQGQFEPSVRFHAHQGLAHVSLTSTGAVFSLGKPGAQPVVLQMNVADSNSAAMMAPHDLLPGRSNYLVGNDPIQWHRGVPTICTCSISEHLSGSGHDL